MSWKYLVTSVLMAALMCVALLGIADASADTTDTFEMEEQADAAVDALAIDQAVGVAHKTSTPVSLLPGDPVILVSMTWKPQARLRYRSTDQDDYSNDCHAEEAMNPEVETVYVGD